jgi:3-methyladenine DNA glycosylase AlkD
MINELKKELQNLSSPEKAKQTVRFFKTGKGQYGEGDRFIGVVVPDQRKVANKFKDCPLSEVTKLLQSPIHEHRLTALFILNLKYQKADNATKDEIVDIYLKNINHINNWDLVDSSAPYFFGEYFYNKDRTLLYKLANKDHLWSQRIAIIATFNFIKKQDYQDTLKLSEQLLRHPHDLIHKAVGWMLREIGNRNLETELAFLDKHTTQMPRTMLRYAIERFEETLRKKYLHKT